MNTCTRTSSAIIALSALILPLQAQQKSAEPVLLLQGATIHTLTSIGSLQSGDVLVQGEHIIAVGADLSGHRKVQDATVISLFGKVITPGLILPWSRLGLTQGEHAVNDSSILSAGFSVANAWDSQSPDIGEAVVAGFTVAHIVPRNRQRLFSGQSALVSLHPDKPQLLIENRFSAGVARLSSVKEPPSVAVSRLASAFSDGRRFRTNRFAIDSGGYFDFPYSREDLEVLIRIVDDENWLAVEAHGREEIRRLLLLARQLHLRLILYGAAESALLAREIAEQGAVVILNPGASSHRGLSPRRALEAARLLNASSVPLMFGSDQPDAPWRVRQAAGIAVAWGLPWEEALKALTLYPAQVLGLPDRGQIRAGKIADLVVWNADPLQLSSRAEKVFFAGTEYRPVSGDELLARKYATSQGISLRR